MLLTYAAVQAKPWAAVPLGIAAAAPAVADTWLERGIALAIAIFVLKFFMAQSEKQNERFVQAMERSLKALEKSVDTFQEFERETRSAHEGMLRILEKVTEQQARLAVAVEKLNEKVDAASTRVDQTRDRVEELIRLQHEGNLRMEEFNRRARRDRGDEPRE